MLSTLYLFKFNNYYNRIIKKYDTIAEYNKNSENPISIPNVNFIPNDYVDTIQVVNIDDTIIPDYLIVSENGTTISSRWFIISSERTSAGQVRLQLHRDTVVDFYDDVIGAPCFIEKGKPQTIQDPAIFNNEDMTFNQIKFREVYIPDETKVPWIVGYIPKNAIATAETITIAANIAPSSVYAKTGANGITGYKWYKYNNKTLNGSFSSVRIYTSVQTKLYKNIFSTIETTDTAIITNINGKYVGYDTISHYKDGNTTYNSKYSIPGFVTHPIFTGYCGDQGASTGYGKNDISVEVMKKIVSNYSSVNTSQLFSNYNSTSISTDDYNTLVKLNGKIIEDDSTTPSTFYKIVIRQYAANELKSLYDLNESVYNAYKDTAVLDSNDPKYTLSENATTAQNHGGIFYSTDSEVTTVDFELLLNDLTFTIPDKDSRMHTNAPYDIFAIPYGNLDIYDGGKKLFTNNPDAAISIAQEITSKLADKEVYDIQLLPYCPVRYCINPNNRTFDINGNTESLVKYKTTNQSVILWANADNVDFNVYRMMTETGTNVAWTDDNTFDDYPIESFKINSAIQFQRFVSPNFSNSMEFNMFKNYGLKGIRVTAQFKPFSPYIKLTPQWEGLYGQDFNDGRGLVLGGDFSLTQLSDTWTNYELENKNYQKIFDRQILNLEVNNAVQREKEIWGIATGTVGGATSGATSGAMAGSVGGPIGMAIGAGVGATVGAGVSLAGGLADLNLNDKLRRETLDYTKDMYGYQLGNIKALPYGLSKVSAIAPDNKMFPFLEYYKATDFEIDALRQKLKYNGYTIMKIGKINDYIHPDEQTYIKGKLIRMDFLKMDYHIANALAEEINKGVFI